MVLYGPRVLDALEDSDSGKDFLIKFLIALEHQKHRASTWHGLIIEEYINRLVNDIVLTGICIFIFS